MSKLDAFLEIAQQMEEEGKDLLNEPCGAYLHKSLKGFARQLRTAVKAFEGATEGLQAVSSNPMAPLVPAYQHALEVEKARSDIREQRKKLGAMEGSVGGMVLCKGGPANETFTQVSNDMPIGAKTDIANAVYFLDKNVATGERTLVYQEEDTQKRYGHLFKNSHSDPPGIILPG